MNMSEKTCLNIRGRERLRKSENTLKKYQKPRSPLSTETERQVIVSTWLQKVETGYADRLIKLIGGGKLFCINYFVFIKDKGRKRGVGQGVLA